MLCLLHLEVGMHLIYIYNENEGLLDIHTEREAQGHACSMNLNLNCITSFYQGDIRITDQGADHEES